MHRKCLAARRPSQTGDPPGTPIGGDQDGVPDCPGTGRIDGSARKLFGGSGEKICLTTQQEGVRGGEDGRIQSKLMLRVSNDGNGKFSLFNSGIEGARAGKRPAENQENTSEKKLKC